MAGLQPGETGCLSGTFSSHLTVSNDGFTLTSVPGERATIRGTVSINESSTDAKFVNLAIDGAGYTSNTFRVIGDRFSLSGSDVTNRYQGRSCLFLGTSSEGWAVDAEIDHNTIHECGLLNDPAGQTHGIYNGFSRNARITNNVIWGAQYYGIQFWPDADGGLFEHNVVDGSLHRSGVVIGGEDGYTSDNNTIRFNIITFNSRNGIASSGDDGPGNAARNNCLFGNLNGDLAGDGFSRSGNLHFDPLYINRLLKNYKVLPGSPCAAMGVQ